MKRLPLAAAMAALLAGPVRAAPLPPPPVSRWSTLPRVAYRADYQPRQSWVTRAQALDGKDGCHFVPDAEGVVRLNVPFVVLFDAKGSVVNAQADAPGCAPLAELVEAFARDLGPSIVVPPKGPPPLWRGSHFLAGWKP